MASNSLTLKAMRAHADAQIPPRVGVRTVVLFLLLEVLLLLAALASFPGPARAEMMKGDVSASTNGGYARIVFTFPEENEADVRIANGVIVISFRKSAELAVDRISAGASAYVGVARRDPDGTAVRLALKRKVTVNSMAAGERLFVDLLPEGWVGVPPGLPQEVIDHLARRAREAEKKARQALLLARQRALPPMKVRLGNHPTFSRYVFELPEPVPVAVDHDKEKLTVLFDAPLRFDLIDVKAALPPMVSAITAEPSEDTVEIRFTFKGKVDVRTFREDSNFVLDLTASNAAPAAGVAVLTQPGDLPGLSLVPPDDKGGALAKPPPIAAAKADERIQDPLPAPAAPAQPGATPRPMPETAPAPAAGRPPPVDTRPATAPPPHEPVKIEEVSAPPQKPAASPASAIASQPAEPAGFPPVQGATEAASDDAREAGSPVVVELRRQGDTLRLVFPFATPTPAAIFRRFDTLWLVFDTRVPIDVTQLFGDPGRVIRSAEVSRSQDGQVVRLKLERPRLASASTSGPTWAVTLGDIMLDRTTPLTINRASVGANRAVGLVPFDQPSRTHRISDPEIGDMLLVVTALGPARGMLRTQDFVEFRALASTHGVALQPLADDVSTEVHPDKILITRPSGLILSGANYQLDEAALQSGGTVLLDPLRWGADRRAQFAERQRQLVQAAAVAPEGKRGAARLNLARFYLGRELFPEAKAVLEVAVSNEQPKAAEPSGLVLRAVAKLMMDRNDDALKDLSHPVLADHKEAALWRALAHARQGNWVQAREGFKAAEAVITTLPIELQRAALKERLRAAIEVQDVGEATQTLNELTTIGIPGELEAAIAVLSGRLAEALGRISDALNAYHSAGQSGDRPAAAQGRLREILLRYSLNTLARVDVISELEVLTTVWRGDETEIEALQLLGHLYIEEKRYRDAFYVMRTALSAFPISPTTRRIQNEASATFEKLFLDGTADAMPAIEALSLFYDFRELTPIGRRGDEMIRRLADRLVSVDLLGQAAELLQHQVDHRLQGAARAQVATRLAVIHLMNRKPDRALQLLRSTRSADLSTELRNQRLLLEARAVADGGRHDLALEVIANLSGREVDRLRADILWSARRWREAGEQIEMLHGERWREFTPLTEAERPDILRAAIGFALGEDQLGLDRLREKYGPKMAEGPLARAFEVVITPFSTNTPEFRTIAKAAAAADTLEQFLRDMRARYPEAGAALPVPVPMPQRQSHRAEPPRAARTSAAAGQLAAVP
ncbi:MAG: tetratricopeptide repeat protein [Xanthobacteraceae bacterium]